VTVALTFFCQRKDAAFRMPETSLFPPKSSSIALDTIIMEIPSTIVSARLELNTYVDKLKIREATDLGTATTSLSSAQLLRHEGNPNNVIAISIFLAAKYESSKAGH
jgi:hypothetical protein